MEIREARSNDQTNVLCNRNLAIVWERHEKWAPPLMKLKQTILIVDNEDDYLAWAKGHLSAPTVSITVANDAELALKKFQEERHSIVIAELRIAPFNGLELLRKIRHTDPNAMVLLTTGFPPTSAVIEAMKLGAYDFLRKETLTYELRPVVETVLQAHEEIRVESTKDTPRQEESNQEDHQDSIIGKSSAMQEVFKMIGRVSRADAPVLITGESGCGKEVVANAIHRFSPRAKSEYVAINCAAIPADLLESELFGHEKGAFTGASQQRIGRFEQCDGGTLFLDEIGDMPMAVQSKILRVLQQGEYSRVGGNQ
ncbi:MAG: sigma 54-interacting transcriptional regulator, partial [Verrucomicrobiota bacterium]